MKELGCEKSENRKCLWNGRYYSKRYNRVWI